MRSRFVSNNAIIHYQMLLNSMGSHLCTKILFLRTFFSLQILCGISDGDRQLFHGDMMIVIRLFIFILPLLNESIVFSI